MCSLLAAPSGAGQSRRAQEQRLGLELQPRGDEDAGNGAAAAAGQQGEPAAADQGTCWGLPKVSPVPRGMGDDCFWGKRQSCLASLAGVSCSVLADDGIHIKPGFLTRENSKNGLYRI